MSMDKTTLKSIIIDLKDKGYTYQDISSILDTRYDIQMSRQAINGMYKRTMEKINNTSITQSVLIKIDIVNYRALGLSPKEIKDILEKNQQVDKNIKISIKDIESTISNSTDYLEEITNEQIKIIKKVYKQNNSTNDCFEENIQNKLTYKEIKPTVNRTNALIKIGIKESIKDIILKEIAKTLSVTDNKQLAKELMTEYNIKANIRELRKFQGGIET